MGLRGALRSFGCLAVLCAMTLTAAAQPATGGLKKGDVVIGTTDPPTLRAYHHDGSFIGSIDLSDMLPPFAFYPTGISKCVFDSTTGRIYALSFGGRFSTDDEILQVRTRPPFAATHWGNPNDYGLHASWTLVRDAAGNFYMGNAGPKPTTCCPWQQAIVAVAPDGSLHDSFLVEVGDQGWEVSILDVTANGDTLYYNTEGFVRRYDTASRSELPSLVFPESAGDLRLLPPFDGSGLLVSMRDPVTDARFVRRIDGEGNTIQNYELPGERGFNLELDPLGPSFWVLTTDDRLYRIGLDSGAIEVGPITFGNANPGSIAVYAPSTKFRRAEMRD